MNLNTFCDDYNLAKDYSDDTTTIYSLGTDLTKEKLLNLIPDVEYPTLTVQSIDGGGLLAGSYQFAVAYKLKPEIILTILCYLLHTLLHLNTMKVLKLVSLLLVSFKLILLI